MKLPWTNFALLIFLFLVSCQEAKFRNGDLVRIKIDGSKCQVLWVRDQVDHFVYTVRLASLKTLEVREFEIEPWREP